MRVTITGAAVAEQGNKWGDTKKLSPISRNNDVFVKISTMHYGAIPQTDFWRIFRFLEDFQIFGGFSDFWKIFYFLEDFQTFGSFRFLKDFWKIFRFLEDF